MALTERQRANERRRYQRNREKRLALQKRIHREKPEAHVRATKTWRERNPEKYRAQTAVNNAIRDGRLKRGECERYGRECSGRVEAHHDDYSKPLDVRWLCVHHHKEVQRESQAETGV